MVKLLMITEERDTFRDFDSGIKAYEGVEIHWVSSDEAAINTVKEIRYHVAVINETISDMSGIEFAELLAKTDPMVNTVVVSRLNDSDFHEKSEGLGVLMKLPPHPDKTDGDLVIKKLNTVLNLATVKTNGKERV